MSRARPVPARHSAAVPPPRLKTFETFPITISRSRRHALAMRWVRGLKYASFLAAALLSFPFPSMLIAGSFHGAWWIFSYVWTVVLLLGAGTSLAGILLRTWIGEYIGLWGVFIALGAYSVSCFLVHPTGNRMVLGLIVLGFAFSAVARLQEVAHAKRHAEYMQRAGSGRRGL